MTEHSFGGQVERRRLLETLTAAVAAILLSGVAVAQDAPPRLEPSVLVSTFETTPAGGPPTIEPYAGGAVFKVASDGRLAGGLNGTLSQRITQVGPGGPPPPAAQPINLQIPIATQFTIATDEGTIEGYYRGYFYFPEETYPDSVVRQWGEVLSVTGAYAGLYQADVFYDGNVHYRAVEGVGMVPTGDTGTLTIAPR